MSGTQPPADAGVLVEQLSQTMTDPKYREKQRQISMTNRIKKKASEADKENNVEPKDVSILVDSESNGISSCVYLSDTTLSEATLLHEDGGGASRHVKKTRRDDAGKGVFRVTTTALTNQNVQAFFAPKWSAPRSKEQRKIAPRPSAI
jgi:hypothetical protein